MEDDRIDRLLKGYGLPEVSAELDHRVLSEGAAVLESVRRRTTIEEVGRVVLDRLGFGYVAWFVDLITTTDAEYGVEFL